MHTLHNWHTFTQGQLTACQCMEGGGAHRLSLGSQVRAVLLQGGGLVAASSTCRACCNSFLALTHHADDLSPDLAGICAQRIQAACSHALAFPQQAEQNVLCANVVVTCTKQSFWFRPFQDLQCYNSRTFAQLHDGNGMTYPTEGRYTESGVLLK